MKKKTFSLILSVFLLVSFTSTALIPMEAYAATAKKTTTVKKKAPAKKKVVKKKTVNLNPPEITLETAPHSEKPVAKKVTKKKVVPKKTVAKKKK
jgi:hypothetical protein